MFRALISKCKCIVFEYVIGTQYCINDTVNTTMVVVLFWTFVYDMLIYYKTWIYHCLIKQVKSLSICSRTSNSVRISQSGRIGNRGMTTLLLAPWITLITLSIYLGFPSNHVLPHVSYGSHLSYSFDLIFT